MYVHALVTGMAVKREIMSNYTITSSSSMERLAISLENWDEIFSEKSFLLCSGDKISVRNLEVLYRVEFVQVTMGLSGLPSLWWVVCHLCSIVFGRSSGQVRCGSSSQGVYCLVGILSFEGQSHFFSWVFSSFKIVSIHYNKAVPFTSFLLITCINRTHHLSTLYSSH